MLGDIFMFYRLFGTKSEVLYPTEGRRIWVGLHFLCVLGSLDDFKKGGLISSFDVKWSWDFCNICMQHEKNELMYYTGTMP